MIRFAKWLELVSWTNFRRNHFKVLQNKFGTTNSFSLIVSTNIEKREREILTAPERHTNLPAVHFPNLFFVGFFLVFL